MKYWVCVGLETCKEEENQKGNQDSAEFERWSEYRSVVGRLQGSHFENSQPDI